MKRRQFLKAAGCSALPPAAIAAPAIAQSMPELKWRLTASWPKSLDTLYGACETFAKYVSEATDGKFQIQTFAAGEIVPGLQVLDAVQNGTVEMGHTAPTTTSARIRPGRCSAPLPFGLNSRQQNAWFYDGDGQKLINEFGKKFNATLSADGQYRRADGRLVPQGDQDRSTTSRVSRCASAAGPARRSASSASCRSRSPAATSIRRWKRAPSTPTEWVGPYDDEKLGFYKVAKYYYYPGWWEGGTAIHFLINLAKWNALPKSYQAIVTRGRRLRQCRCRRAIRCAQSAGAEAAGRGRHAAAAVLAGDHGGLPEGVERGQRRDLGGQCRLQEGLGLACVAFRNDEYLWWQVAEYTYDTFMIRTPRDAAESRHERMRSGPARKAGPVALLGAFRRLPLTTLVEPLQTGFSSRAPSWFRPCPERANQTRARAGGSRYEKPTGGYRG